MNYESPPAKDDYLTKRFCEYQPLTVQRRDAAQLSHACCHKPDLGTWLCHVSHFRNHWLKNLLPRISGRIQDISVVAYVRADDDGPNEQEQMEAIHSYCLNHGYHVATFFEDSGRPSSGLNNALDGLNKADALIAVDLNRFVEHKDNRLRDLRPFICHFFCHTKKHLITIAEGIDTSFPAGQVLALDILKELE